MKKPAFLLQYFPMALVGSLIVVWAIVYRQPFFKTVPMLITLGVQLLLARADKRAFLLGGLNSVLYGLVYLSEALYFSVISALLISMPLQLFSYFHWKKHSEKGNTELRVLGVKWGSLTILGIVIGYVGCAYFLLPFFKDAAHSYLDILLFVLGTTVTLLSAFRFLESQYISICSTVVSTVLWVTISVRDPSFLNYVVIACYNLFRITQAAIVWTKQYIQFRQKKESIS